MNTLLNCFNLENRYHVVVPCSFCLGSDNNGHYWMFNDNQVESSVRLDKEGKEMNWHHLPSLEAEEVPSIFLEEPPEDFNCPVCFELMEEPIKLNTCNHIFCKRCIVREADIRKACPLDRVPLDQEKMEEDQQLKQKISEIKIKCRYGCTQKDGEWTTDDKGCKEFISFKNRNLHESSCPFKK